MALGRKVHNVSNRLGPQNSLDHRLILNSAWVEANTARGFRILPKVLHGRQVAGVGKRVEGDNIEIGVVGQNVPAVVAPDEPCCAGDENRIATSQIRNSESISSCRISSTGSARPCPA